MINLDFTNLALALKLGAGQYLPRPPRMSPVVDLTVLVRALGLFFYGCHIKVNVEKLRSLKHALAMDGTAGRK
jgi:hypothetical protein